MKDTIGNSCSSSLDTLYTLLNIHRGCTAQELRKAYLDMAIKHHPDNEKEKDKEKNLRKNGYAFIRIKNAYDTILSSLSLSPHHQTENDRDTPSFLFKRVTPEELGSGVFCRCGEKYQEGQGIIECMGCSYFIISN